MRLWAEKTDILDPYNSFRDPLSGAGGVCPASPPKGGMHVTIPILFTIHQYHSLFFTLIPKFFIVIHYKSKSSTTNHYDSLLATIDLLFILYIPISFTITISSTIYYIPLNSPYIWPPHRFPRLWCCRSPAWRDRSARRLRRRKRCRCWPPNETTRNDGFWPWNNGDTLGKSWKA